MSSLPLATSNPTDSDETDEPMAIVDRWLKLFARAMDNDRIPRNGVQELAAAVKLKQFLINEFREQDHRRAASATPSLAELQRRHQQALEVRRQLELHPELGGELIADRAEPTTK